MRKHELYQDVRGSMTQFEPITPEQVEAVSDGAFTYTAACGCFKSARMLMC